MKRWLSIKDVCEQCGIERTTFYRRQNSPKWPTLVPLEKMKPRIYFKAEDVDTYHAMIEGADGGVIPAKNDNSEELQGAA